MFYKVTYRELSKHKRYITWSELKITNKYWNTRVPSFTDMKPITHERPRRGKRNSAPFRAALVHQQRKNEEKNGQRERKRSVKNTSFF